ncbi:HEAT repeat domain-containing protein [Algoriphagus sp. PAP.12]|uniref:HEAT repeat domain-containing protein n=1 Tax=Algoriphagus sp. PAP.12 TaxID=2996678 RepID=UPI00227A4086|nr:HEAT repeat domain-containing protein [Algoriphagus sp. PAP.12]
MLKKTIISWCICLLVFEGFGQGISVRFQDSTSLINEIKEQESIPNLFFRFEFPFTEARGLFLSDSSFSWSKTDSSYISKPFTNGKEIDSLFLTLPADSIDLKFFVFEEKSDIKGVASYLETLHDTGDFILSEDQQRPEKDLVLMASRNHYEPLDEYRNKLMSDKGLFSVTLINILFIILSIFMIIFMVIFKKKRNQREYNIKAFENEIIEPLTTILFEKSLDEIKEMTPEMISSIYPKQIFQKRLFKKVLIDKIIGLNKKMKGDFKDKLKVLYKKFGLVEITKSNLKHRHWDNVVSGLVQVNEMDLTDLLPLVKEHSQSSNFHVRSQAGATLLNLSEKVDLKFLRDQSYPLSDWQQMHYLRIIKFVSSSKSLNIPILFSSENQSVREFGIKLVRMLGRVDLIEELHKINKQVLEEEKAELIKTYDVLGAHMEVDFINQCMTSDNSELQKEAIKSAGNLGNEESEKIILDLLNQDPDFPTRKILLRSLFKLNKQTFEEYILTHASHENLSIQAHLLDPVLNHV